MARWRCATEARLALATISRMLLLEQLRTNILALPSRAPRSPSRDHLGPRPCPRCATVDELICELLPLQAAPNDAQDRAHELCPETELLLLCRISPFSKVTRHSTTTQISCCLEVAAMRSSRVEKSPMPSAGARTERRENHPADFLFALALCSVHFLKLPQD